MRFSVVDYANATTSHGQCLMQFERIRSKISIGSTGNPALRCADCEGMIQDDVLGCYPNYLESIAQGHRCDEAEQARYLLKQAEYNRNWRKGKDGQ